MDPEGAYPGDAFVDIIGMDFYWDLRWSPNEPITAYDFMVTRKWGLQWHQDFATAHGKPTAYSEWGIMSNDGASYIQRVEQWFARHNVVYQNYWNSNADFKGLVSTGEYPLPGPPTSQHSASCDVRASHALYGAQAGIAARFRNAGFGFKMRFSICETARLRIAARSELGRNQA